MRRNPLTIAVIKDKGLVHRMSVQEPHPNSKTS